MAKNAVPVAVKNTGDASSRWTFSLHTGTVTGLVSARGGRAAMLCIFGDWGFSIPTDKIDDIIADTVRFDVQKYKIRTGARNLKSAHNPVCPTESNNSGIILMVSNLSTLLFFAHKKRP